MTRRNYEMEQHLKTFDDCLQHEVSFCTGACPYNLDVNTFISRIQEGRFNAAYKAFRDATGFPEIAARICSAPCGDACLRNAVSRENSEGEPIALPRLERACLEFATRKDPVSYNIPSKNKSIAIIGAGISGMACALRMATKKYRVTVYEKTDRRGGGLLDILDPETIDAEFELQLQHLDINMEYNREITSIDQVLTLGYEDNRRGAEAAVSAVASVMRSSSINASTKYSGTYDAIYVATGKDGPDFGLKESLCTLIGDTAVFLGGSLLGRDYGHALSDGLRIATAIDNYTLTGILKYPEYPGTDISIDETLSIDDKTIVPKGSSYTKEEAVAEAKRCLKCQCNSCRLHCDLTDYLHKWPLRLRDEIIATTAPGKSELHATPAVRTINMCTHCGLCKETCPSGIDLDGFILSARARMHKLEKMPWAFNDFFIRDLEFSMGSDAFLCSNGPGEKTSKYLFFPGCQLGAREPDTLMKAYDALLHMEPMTGIMLGCCGIPAKWAGDETLLSQVTDRIRSCWESTGKPTVILACPSCHKVFKDHLPEVETTFIYDMLSGLNVEEIHSLPSSYHIFDPCVTSPEDDVRQSIRSICERAGLSITPLPIQEKWSACCSYGGHGEFADPQFSSFVRQKRVSEGPLPFITYCVNCRDSFIREGKESYHILNLIFGTRPQEYTVTQLRENRIKLREVIMNKLDIDIPSNSQELEDLACNITLIMEDDVRKKISSEYILEEDLAKVVEFCERTGRRVYNRDDDSYSGYKKIGNLTHWAVYRKTSEPNTCQLLNAYTHRMEIELEMIWNGKKINTDEL